MLTTAKELRRHLIRWENEVFHLRYSGDPDGRLGWLETYVEVLRRRLVAATGE